MQADSVVRCYLAWHNLCPVNISIVVIMVHNFVLRIKLPSRILLLGDPHHKEESQCEEVDKLYNADETKTHKKATNATEVTYKFKLKSALAALQAINLLASLKTSRLMMITTHQLKSQHPSFQLTIHERPRLR
jgi:hypothetical protein